MFDLFRSRDKAVRYMLGALLGVVALSMVITLIPGFGSSSGNSTDDQVVADIGKTPLTAREVQTEMPELAPKPKKKDYRGYKGRKGARKGSKKVAKKGAKP